MEGKGAPQRARRPAHSESGTAGGDGLGRSRARLFESAEYAIQVPADAQYREVLRRIAGTQGAGWRGRALLVPETDNRDDANAVRVEVRRQTVGYLDHRSAAYLQPSILTLEDAGQRVVVPASIHGTGSALRVVLHADSDEIVQAAASRGPVWRTRAAIVADHRRTSRGTYYADDLRSRTTTLLLCALLGFLGAHRFYTGHTTAGLLQMLTLGGGVVWWLIDLVRIARGTYTDVLGRRLRR